ncbi:MAG: hypothetical protein LBC23_02125, partial [Coriobacteriales bacterium]|nr:hypothetical protein [Coriobacteriales bacterium]
PTEVAALSGTALNELLSEQCGGAAIPARLAALDGLPQRFTQVCAGSTEGIEGAVAAWLAR